MEQRKRLVAKTYIYTLNNEDYSPRKLNAMLFSVENKTGLRLMGIEANKQADGSWLVSEKWEANGT